MSNNQQHDETQSVYQAVAELEKSNGAGAICTIIRSRGSTPRHATSKMLVYPDGHFIGTVGGGAQNIASALSATVSGGQFNTASGYASTVSGGGAHAASSPRDTTATPT